MTSLDAGGGGFYLEAVKGSYPSDDTWGRFWQQRWQNGETPWDHGEPAPPFREFTERHGVPYGEVLIPGCGSGHDVRLFAELGAQVTGMDIAPEALAVAARLNPHSRVRYLEGDILHPDTALYGRFDWILEHTCLCALPPQHWPAYAEGVRRLLRAGGRYAAIFYRRPHDPDGPPFGISAEQIDSLFRAGFVELDAWTPSRAYPSRQGREEMRLFERVPDGS